MFALAWNALVKGWVVVHAAEATDVYLDPDGNDRWVEHLAAIDAASDLNGRPRGWWKGRQP
jgi:hypothetical protein